MKQTILLLVLNILSISLFGSENPRKQNLLDEGWKFINEDVENAAMPDFNDIAWETVYVPHDWAIDKPFDLNVDYEVLREETNWRMGLRFRTGNSGALPTVGIGWYRKSVYLPAEDKGKKISVEFDGAMSNAQVFFNGEYVGEWPYGYASFSFDLTKFAKFGTENILAVRLKNEAHTSRWYPGAGIYRNVRLVTTNPVHVAHWGTYITTPQINEKKGTVNVKTKIENQSSELQIVELITEIQDPFGKVVATKRSQRKVVEMEEFDDNIDIKNPMLWSIDSPNLHKAISKVYVNKILKDVYETTFGLRTIYFDNNKGFFLNGKHVKIKGVCLHHDLGPLGAAVNYRATERQLEMLKEMGCNAIRTSHNPPSPEQLELCDKMGFLVMVESFDEWREGKKKNGYNTLFDEWAEKDLVALIHRDRNHPSAIMWSIGNEVRELHATDSSGRDIARFLVDICHREDPTRPTVSGNNSAVGAINSGIADEVDIFGINYPRIGNKSYTSLHKEYPKYCLIGSETSSTVSSRGVYKFPLTKKRNPWPWYDDYQLSSYDMEGPSWASAPDEEFAMQEDCDAVAGEFVWTGIDYLGEPLPYNESGSPAKSSYFGMIDLAGLKKDRFYLYQSHWSDQPMLHLLPHWNWPDRMNDTVPVMCYTNYPKAELFVNGKSMGVRSKDESNTYTRYRLVWDNVIYKPGDIKVVAMDDNNNPMDSMQIKTAGEPNKIRLTPDRETIHADGKDIIFITVEVLDKDGNLCPRANLIQFFEIEGAGKIKAVCNGDPTDLTSFASSYMKTFNGKMVVAIQSTKEAGEITLSSIGSMLQEGKIIIHTRN